MSRLRRSGRGIEPRPEYRGAAAIAAAKRARQRRAFGLPLGCPWAAFGVVIGCHWAADEDHCRVLRGFAGAFGTLEQDSLSVSYAAPEFLKLRLGPSPNYISKIGITS